MEKRKRMGRFAVLSVLALALLMAPTATARASSAAQAQINAGAAVDAQLLTDASAVADQSPDALTAQADSVLVPTQRIGAIGEAPMEAQPPLTLKCTAALLMEPLSGQIIFEQNADEKIPVASVTKEMSILLALEALSQGRVKLNAQVVVSSAAAGMGGSQVLLDPNSVHAFGELLKSMIIASANDASVAVGEHLFGSEAAFVNRMNQRAKELSMTNTHYVNCTGLPAKAQYTTARDVARVSGELTRYAQYFLYSTIWMDELVHEGGRVTSLTNTNRMIRLYEGCDGLKTGSTNEAGYCVSATAKRGEMRLIAVVLGAETSKARFEMAGQMLDHGFANYQRYPVAQRGTRIKGDMPVTGGDSRGVKLMLDGDLSLLIAKGEERAVALVPELPAALRAPVTIGQKVGVVRVMLDDQQIARIPVVAAESVNKPGLMSGLERIIRRWFYR